MVAFAALLPFGFQQSSALSCLYQTPQERFDNAHVVYSATAVSVIESQDGSHHWAVTIGTIYKNNSEHFTLAEIFDKPWDGTTNPSTRLQAGEDYLFYLDGNNSLNACNYPTKKADVAEEEWQMLGNGNPNIEFEPFSDVSGDYPYLEAINWAQQQYIVAGYSDGTFKPNATVNRAEFSKILLEYLPDTTIMVNPVCTLSSTPSDVVQDSWYFNYVCTAINGGFLRGYPDGTFKPAQTINFAEAAVIIDRMILQAEFCIGDDGWFSETKCPASKVWYQASLDRLKQKISIPASITSPEHAITRSEMVELLWRLQKSV